MIRPSNEHTSEDPDASDRLASSDRPLAHQAPGAQVPARPRKALRRLKLFVIAVLVGLLIAVAVAPTAARWVIRRQLQAALADNLLGELTVGSISFDLPWGVSLGNTSFVSRMPSGESIEMFRVPKLMIRLAGSPLAKGPIAIDMATIDDVAIHLVRTRDGIVGIRPDPPPSANKKMSDLVLLKHFAVSGAQFTFEDRTEPNAVPMEWRKIGLNVDNAGTPSGYTYRFTGEGASIASIDSAGKADLDSFLINVEECNATLVHGATVRQSPLPAAVQLILREFGVAGEVAVHGSGVIPVLQPSGITYKGDATLKGGATSLDDIQSSFDHIASQLKFDAPSLMQLNVDLSSFDASAGDTSLHLEKTPVSLDFQKMTWSANIAAAKVAVGPGRQTLPQSVRDMLSNWNVHGAIGFSIDAAGPLNSPDPKAYRAELHLQPNNLSIQPPDMGTPVDRFADMTATLKDGVLSVQQIRARCGDDIFYLKEATVSLADLPAKLAVSQLNGSLTFGAKHGVYPPSINDVLAKWSVHGAISFSVDAAGPLNSPDPKAYRAELHLQPGDLSIQPPDMGTPVDRFAEMTATLKDGVLSVERIRARCADDIFYLKEATVSLADLPAKLKVSQLNGSLTFGAVHGVYPPQINDMLVKYGVHGTIGFSLDSAAAALGSTDPKAFAAELHLRPNELRIQPPDMGSPIDRFADVTATLKDGNLVVQQVRAMCGDDIVFLKEATIGLAEMPTKISVSKLSGAVTFGDNHGVYPPDIAEYITRYDPRGAFLFSGNLSLLPLAEKDKVDYNFELHTPRGQVSLLDGRLPIYNVKAQVHILPGAIMIDTLNADAIGGQLTGTGKIEMGQIPSYALDLKGTALDLGDLGKKMTAPGKEPPPVSGRANLTVTCTGSIPPEGSVLDHLKAKGKFDIRQGKFFEVPVLKAIAEAAKNKDAAMVSDASAQFHVAQKQLFFDRAVIAAPALGVEAVGSVDFDGKLDFHKVSALAGGDWRRNTGETTAAGEVLGKVQDILNTATRFVWYDLDVTGTVNDPIVVPTILPFIYKPAVHFKEMLGGDGK